MVTVTWRRWQSTKRNKHSHRSPRLHNGAIRRIYILKQLLPIFTGVLTNCTSNNLLNFDRYPLMVIESKKGFQETVCIRLCTVLYLKIQIIDHKWTKFLTESEIKRKTYRVNLFSGLSRLSSILLYYNPMHSECSFLKKKLNIILLRYYTLVRCWLRVKELENIQYCYPT